MGTFSLKTNFAGRAKYRAESLNYAMIIFGLNDQLTQLAASSRLL
jgi:hypothetical protein